MVDGIEGIGGYGGGREHAGGGGGRGAPVPRAPARKPVSAARAPAPAAFAPVADLLDDIARLAESDAGAPGGDAATLAARMLAAAGAARGAQARLDASCVRALLDPERTPPCLRHPRESGDREAGERRRR